MGSQIDDDVEIRVVRDTDTVKHLHIPAAPSEGEISDDDLVGAQGGLLWVLFVKTALVSAAVGGSASAITTPFTKK